jgi:Tol biopolymer transport system component
VKPAAAIAVLLIATSSASVASPSTTRPPRASLSYSVGTPAIPQGTHGLCLVAPGNGAGVRLTGSGHRDRESSWSPDGLRVLFTRDLHEVAPDTGGSDNFSDVFVADAAGHHVRDLTHPGNVYDDHASWSRDGKRIVFVGYWHDSGLTTMRADGTRKHEVAASSLFYASPSFSRDGKLLLYSLSADGGPGQSSSVYVMPAGGGPQRLLVSHAGQPSWSPDGSRIAFVQQDGDFLQVFVANADGTDAHAVTSDDGDASRPQWSPGGRLIAYTRAAPRPAPGRPPPRFDVHVVGADGSNDHVAITNPLGSYDPAWRPARALPRHTHYRACR